MIHARYPVVYIRNVIFGIEDSLVSTVGLLSGIAVTGVGNRIIMLTGIVLICVEAFSMAVGSLLSEDSVKQFESQGRAALRKSLGGAVAMFFSYFCAGFIPLLPYVFTNGSRAFWLSVSASLLGLFVLGITSGKYLHINSFRHGLKMFILGGIAVALGVGVGMLVEGLK